MPKPNRPAPCTSNAMGWTTTASSSGLSDDRRIVAGAVHATPRLGRSAGLDDGTPLRLAGGGAEQVTDVDQFRPRDPTSNHGVTAVQHGQTQPAQATVHPLYRAIRGCLGRGSAGPQYSPVTAPSSSSTRIRNRGIASLKKRPAHGPQSQASPARWMGPWQGARVLRNSSKETSDLGTSAPVFWLGVPWQHIAL